MPIKKFSQKSTEQSQKKVFVGMSGGVDSSVSALLLKQAGFDVTGVFIKVWQPENGECTWRDERRDAMRVAAALDIPFLTLDLSKEYKKEVVDYMINEYRLGRTPNPDVMCNRYVKFGAFWDFAKKHGADAVATGHYAQCISIDGGKASEAMPVYQLLEGADKNKDQSYFLWTLTQVDLEHVLFPIGHLQKSEVRTIAEKNSLPVFDKKDSQGICFIGHVDMKEFLKEYIAVEKGQVLDTDDRVVGEHDGALLYTLGERHGFTIFNKTTDEESRYVIAKDIERNTITVAKHDEYQKGTHIERAMHLSRAHFNLQRYQTAQKVEAEVRFRYRQKRQSCTIYPQEQFRLELHGQELAPTPGQSVVFYDGEVCIGGGILELS